MTNTAIINVTNVTADAVLTLKPKQFWELPSDVLTAVAPLLRAKAKEAEAVYRAAQDAGKASYGSDAYAQWDLACKCRDWAEKAERLRTMQPYQVNAKLMSLAKPSAYFMHCLPAHPGEEVSAEVLESKQSIIFDQAENRLHLQKAILAHLAAHRG